MQESQCKGFLGSISLNRTAHGLGVVVYGLGFTSVVYRLQEMADEMKLACRCVAPRQVEDQEGIGKQLGDHVDIGCLHVATDGPDDPAPSSPVTADFIDADMEIPPVFLARRPCSTAASTAAGTVLQPDIHEMGHHLPSQEPVPCGRHDDQGLTQPASCLGSMVASTLMPHAGQETPRWSIGDLQG